MQEVVLLDEKLDGLKETVQVQDEQGETTEREFASKHHLTTDAQKQRLTQDTDHNCYWSVDTHDLSGEHVGIAVLTDNVTVMNDVVSLAVVGRDDSNAVERFGEIG